METTTKTDMLSDNADSRTCWQVCLTSPLDTDWQEQYVRLVVPGSVPEKPLSLTIDGRPTPMQYTGRTTTEGAEVLLRLGFTRGETHTLVFSETTKGEAVLTRQPMAFEKEMVIGIPGRELRVSPTAPFVGFAGRTMASTVRCETAFEGASLAVTNDGPLFIDYEVVYRYAEHRCYTLVFRCYKQDTYIEVSERFSLGMNAEIVWTLNPERHLTHIISRDSFEGESQPSIEPLGETHPRDVLCRLQMPVLSEYFIPNNRGWFAFYDARKEDAGMIGILGLYGARWEEPVANMPELLDRDGTVEWHASLASGTRYWLLYAGALETEYTPERRFVFHRLHAEFNALRLDEHLDLDGEKLFDTSCACAPGVFGPDYRERAQRTVAALPCLQRAEHATLQALLSPTKELQQTEIRRLLTRFERWVHQFQGYRTGENDYAKNVIGFSRCLRGMLISYELLRKDGALTDEQIRQLNVYFTFAARRILDEGRWPHSRTWKHPDHPESSRDFYNYGGEHKPDRLVWTNCLPNFQSDPMCALAHLSAIFKDHPDAAYWLRFALDDIDRQLDAYCGESGAWAESINYALYTLSYFVITFKAVKARWGIDYFNDTRVRRLVGWLCRFFGPYDKRLDAYTWPAIGNAVLPQNQAEYLLCYANELDADDPLRADCMAIWQRCADHCHPSEHYPIVMAAMVPLDTANANWPVRPLPSEVMDEVGVAMRHRHTAPDESYLFQKIGFAKDHYEADETAFNWYAKGTPFLMDYGTYTGDVAIGAAHNAVEIPDEDSLRRGYLANHLFSSLLDYTHCEVPVTLKLLWGKVRTFAEIEAMDGKVAREKTPYFYIGDQNPVGPKTWKVRQLLFVKPDYLVLFDRVYGEVPHRYNLHVTGTDLHRNGSQITAKGRFDLDLLAYIQHPQDFEMVTGELIPHVHPGCGGEETRARHAQDYFRLYNSTDGKYRTVLFARERGRMAEISGLGEHGVKITTADYTDYVFLHNDYITTQIDDVRFSGRSGWIRCQADGLVQACVPDGDIIAAFGVCLEGRGPWTYNLDGTGTTVLCGGAPRTITVTEGRASR